MTFSDGQVYEGEFHGGLSHGAGKESYPDGEVFEVCIDFPLPILSCCWFYHNGGFLVAS